MPASPFSAQEALIIGALTQTFSIMIRSYGLVEAFRCCRAAATGRRVALIGACLVMRFPYRISQGAPVIHREPPEFRNRRLQMLVRHREAMLAIVVGGNARRLPCCGACPTMTISVVIMRNLLG